MLDHRIIDVAIGLVFRTHLLDRIIQRISKADENGPSAPGPFSDLKLTQFGRNRTLGLERRLSG